MDSILVLVFKIYDSHSQSSISMKIAWEACFNAVPQDRPRDAGSVDLGWVPAISLLQGTSGDPDAGDPGTPDERNTSICNQYMTFQIPA